jgi:hypothetical protein
LSNLIVITYDLSIIGYWVKLSTCFCILKAFISFPTDLNLSFFYNWKGVFSLEQFQNYQLE